MDAGAGLFMCLFVCLCLAPQGVPKHPECSAPDLLCLPALHVQRSHLLPDGVQTPRQTVSTVRYPLQSVVCFRTYEITV